MTTSKPLAVMAQICALATVGSFFVTPAYAQNWAIAASDNYVAVGIEWGTLRRRGGERFAMTLWVQRSTAEARNFAFDYQVIRMDFNCIQMTYRPLIMHSYLIEGRRLRNTDMRELPNSTSVAPPPGTRDYDLIMRACGDRPSSAELEAGPQSEHEFVAAARRLIEQNAAESYRADQ